MAGIAIVTDTSSDLSPAEASAAGIRLVPLTVSFGEASYEAGTELTNEDFYGKLTAPGAPFPRTAAPSPERFAGAFREALDDGAGSVVCVTISQKLSATHASAVSAAETFEPGLVEVVDSRTTTHALGLMAREAARLGSTGATAADIVAAIEDLVRRADLLFAVDTLEFLHRGGRIGRASALLGSALSIKPILRLADGEVASADRQRTTAKARARLIELACARPVERAIVLHTLTPGIEAFRDEFAAAAGLASSGVDIGLVGPVAGAHVGPGLCGIALITPSAT
jgi:DegV family protein with EDD domain